MRLTWPTKGAHFEALHTAGVSVSVARISACV